MDICMLIPSERALIQEVLGEYEEVKTKLLTVLEEIEGEWKQEVQQAPDPWPGHTERMVLPRQRLDILSDWIREIDAHDIYLEDMDEVMPLEIPATKSAEDGYRIENYTLEPAKREELKTLIDGYSEGVTKLMVFLKGIVAQWEDHYEAEPGECTNEEAAAEIEGRLDVLDRWISDIEPREKPDIADIE